MFDREKKKEEKKKKEIARELARKKSLQLKHTHEAHTWRVCSIKRSRPFIVFPLCSRGGPILPF